MACAQCAEDLVFSKDKVVIKCVQCSSSFHVSCTRTGTVENFKKLSENAKLRWTCDNCSKGSETSKVCEPNPILESINLLRQEMTRQIGEVNANVSGVRDQLEQVYSSISALELKVSSVSAGQANNKESIARLEKENINMKDELEKIRAENQSLSQYSRVDNIEIVGVPYTENENIYAILEKLAGAIGVKWSSYDISIAHRLARNVDRPNPTIVVRFVYRVAKDGWMRGYRQHRRTLTGASLSSSWPSYNIYINDHLTPYFKSILGRARRLKREKKLGAAWSRDCKVFAKKTDNPDSAPILLRTMEDLEKLVTE